MGTVKDLVDLVTQLSNRVKDRKFAAELREIQSMIGSIQSEHAAIHEQRIALMTENAELQQTIASLKEKIVTLKQEAMELKNQPIAQPGKLSDEAEKILVFLTQHTDVTSHQIAQGIALDITRTEYWLNLLENDDMVYAAFNLVLPTKYSIGQNGREYLITNNMI